MPQSVPMTAAEPLDRTAVVAPARECPTTEVEDALVEMTRLAVAGQRRDPEMFAARLAHRLRHRHPELSRRLAATLKAAGVQFSPLRGR